MAKSGHKGICRIDQPPRNTFGWYVRVTFNQTTRRKFFSDKASGSKRKALEAAIKYRNEVEKEVGRPRTDRLVSSGSGRNESGVTGVVSAILLWLTRLDKFRQDAELNPPS